MRRGLTIAVAFAAIGLVPAHADARKAATVFDGTCGATNVAVTHTPPMTGTLQATHIDIAGDQLCSGVVTRGRRHWRIHSAPTPVSMHGDGLTSCELSATSGIGEIVLAKRWRLRYHYLEPRLAARQPRLSRLCGRARRRLGAPEPERGPGRRDPALRGRGRRHHPRRCRDSRGPPGRMTRARLIRATVLAALLALAPAATAASPNRIETFSGTCESQAEVRMDPPMSSTVQETRVDIASVWARCSGTIESQGRVHRVVNAPTVGELHASGPSSCQLSATQGTGHFTIANRWRIDFTYVEPRLGPVGMLPYSGVAGGSAIDVARLSSSEDPIDVIRRCGAEGVPSVLVDVSIRTAPSISG
jgi:hypothetical protein